MLANNFYFQTHWLVIILMLTNGSLLSGRLPFPYLSYRDPSGRLGGEGEGGEEECTWQMSPSWSIPCPSSNYGVLRCPVVQLLLGLPLFLLPSMVPWRIVLHRLLCRVTWPNQAIVLLLMATRRDSCYPARPSTLLRTQLLVLWSTWDVEQLHLAFHLKWCDPFLKLSCQCPAFASIKENGRH